MQADKAIIQKIHEAVDGGRLTLNDWEAEFVEDMEALVDKGDDLSRKRREKLGEILDGARAW